MRIKEKTSARGFESIYNDHLAAAGVTYLGGAAYLLP